LTALFKSPTDSAGKFMDVSLEGFQTALHISCFSLVQLCKALEPAMNDNASVMAHLTSYHGGHHFEVWRQHHQICIRFYFESSFSG